MPDVLSGDRPVLSVCCASRANITSYCKIAHFKVSTALRTHKLLKPPTYLNSASQFTRLDSPRRLPCVCIGAVASFDSCTAFDENVSSSLCVWSRFDSWGVVVGTSLRSGWSAGFESRQGQDIFSWKHPERMWIPPLASYSMGTGFLSRE